MSKSWMSSLLNGAAALTVLAPSAAVVSTGAALAQDAEIELKEVVVTARGREETLLEIPVSVSAFGQAQIDEAGITDIDGLADYTPGFDFKNSDGQSGGRSSSVIQFRGVVQQVNATISRTAGVFWDGSFVSAGVGFIPLIDVERVEVIKGPQNAQFARNTFSGAINYLPKLPGDEFEANGEFEMGFGESSEEQTTYRGVIAAGGPLSDTLGLRVAASYDRTGADYEYLDGSPQGEEKTFSVFATSTWDPTDNFRVKATGFFVDSEDTSAAQAVNATVQPGDCNLVYNGNALNGLTGELTPFSTDLSQSNQRLFCGSIPDASVFQASASGDFSTSLFGPPSPNPDMAEFTDLFPSKYGNKYGAWRANLSFEWDLTSGHTVSGLISQGEAELGGVQDFFYGEDGVVGAPATFTFGAGYQNWTKDTFYETRIASASDRRFRYEVGVSYYEQEYRNGNGFNSDWQDNESIGLFGLVDFDITDALTLSAEGRYVDDEQTIIYNGAPGVAAGVIPVGATVDASASYTDFMPRVILSYSPIDTLNLYASFSQSSLNSISTNAASFTELTGTVVPGVGEFTDIQELTSYEVGTKQVVNEWLRYSVAVYLMEWDNQPFLNTVLLEGGTAGLNLDGDSEYAGVDFEVTVSPIEGLEVTGALGWVDAELKSFGSAGSVATNVLCPSAGFTNGAACTAFSEVQTISAAGNAPRRVSEWTGAVAATYTFDVQGREFYIRGDALYDGDSFVDNFAYNQLDGSWRGNIRAGAGLTDNLRGEIFVNNVTDEDSLQSAGTTSFAFGPANTGRKTISILPERREFGIRLIANY